MVYNGYDVGIFPKKQVRSLYPALVACTFKAVGDFTDPSQPLLFGAFAMTEKIPDFQKMTTEERATLVTQLRERAAQLEKEGEAAQKKAAKARDTLAQAQGAADAAQAEVDSLFDKSYYLRRMAHAVEMYQPSPP